MSHTIVNRKSFREFLATKGIKFESIDNGKNLIVHDVSSQKLLDLGFEFCYPTK